MTKGFDVALNLNLDNIVWSGSHSFLKIVERIKYTTLLNGGFYSTSTIHLMNGWDLDVTYVQNGFQKGLKM